MLHHFTRLAPALAALLVACGGDSTPQGSVAIATVSPGVVQGGDTSESWTVTGTGFVAGAGVLVQEPGVGIANVTVVSENELTFELTAPGTLTTGTTLMRVTNPDSASANFSVPVVPETVSLSAEVQPIFSSTCAVSGCHQAGSVVPDLSDGNAHVAIVDVASGQDALKDLIEPGIPAGSYLVDKVEGNQAQGSQMPLNAQPLDALERALLRAWVEGGALDN